MPKDMAGGLIVAGAIALYLLVGEAVLAYNLKYRWIRPLTDKETFLVVIMWWNWL